MTSLHSSATRPMSPFFKMPLTFKKRLSLGFIFLLSKSPTTCCNLIVLLNGLPAIPPLNCYWDSKSRIKSFFWVSFIVLDVPSIITTLLFFSPVDHSLFIVICCHCILSKFNIFILIYHKFYS